MTINEEVCKLVGIKPKYEVTLFDEKTEDSIYLGSFKTMKMATAFQDGCLTMISHFDLEDVLILIERKG